MSLWAVGPEKGRRNRRGTRQPGGTMTDDQPFEPLLAFLETVPAVRLLAGRRSIGRGVNDDGTWWIKFSPDASHPLAWRVVQELAHVLNLLSVDDRLPTVFKPVSPPPYINGGVEFLSWVIEVGDPKLTPTLCAEWLKGRLPRPVTDVAAWNLDGDGEALPSYQGVRIGLGRVHHLRMSCLQMSSRSVIAFALLSAVSLSRSRASVSTSLGVSGRYELRAVDGANLPLVGKRAFLDSGSFEVRSKDTVVFRETYRTPGGTGLSATVVTRMGYYRLYRAESGTVYGNAVSPLQGVTGPVFMTRGDSVFVQATLETPITMRIYTR